MRGWRLVSSKSGRMFRAWRMGRNSFAAIHVAFGQTSHPVFFGKSQRELNSEIERWEAFTEQPAPPASPSAAPLPPADP